MPNGVLPESMKTVKNLRRILVGGSLVLAAFTAGMLLPHASPAPSAPDLARLYDPAVIARTLCRTDRPRTLGFFVQSALAAEVPVRQELRSPRIAGLGDLSYRITTQSPDAQFFFDQGLRLFYAFNPGEAVASFRAASDADPACALCRWGEALTLGPNLNGPMQDADIPAALEAVKKAQQLASAATPAEQALIQAIATRYSADKKRSRDDLDIAYADAMAAAYAAHPDDMNMATIAAEAALNVGDGPWQQWWDRTGRFPNSYVAAAIKAIEAVLAAEPEHPGAIHLYIHALDGSAFVDKALPHARKLAQLMPEAGHMVHMPAHTYYSLGLYKDALATNLAAIEADDAYLKGQAAATFVYRFGLYQHNVQFAIAAAEMAGDADNALRLGELLQAFQAQHEDARWDVATGTAVQAAVRFKAPEELLALPRPDRKRPYMVGLWHYARGSAHAYRKDSRSALAEARGIDRLLKDKKLGDMEKNLLSVAAEVVRGRAAAAQSKWLEAATHFGKAVEFQDEVPYRDPPFWNYPVRQAQGVALLRAGKTAQAGETLRQALIESPNSAYALHGLREVAMAQADATAAREYGKLFENAWAGTTAPELDRL